jgi:LPXTG-motif cell wall-anchored protein
LRKVMLLAAMVAMVLAAAAPALAQQIGGDQGPVGGEDAVQAGDNVQYAAVCQNIIGAFDASAAQAGFSGAAAFAEENAAAVSEVAQNQNVSVSQVNECLNAFFASVDPTASSTASSTASATATAGAAATATVLPSTGGFVPSSALALGAGALLVAGGLLARRIIR